MATGFLLGTNDPGVEEHKHPALSLFLVYGTAVSAVLVKTYEAGDKEHSGRTYSHVLRALGRDGGEDKVKMPPRRFLRAVRHHPSSVKSLWLMPSIGSLKILHGALPHRHLVQE